MTPPNQGLRLSAHSVQVIKKDVPIIRDVFLFYWGRRLALGRHAVRDQIFLPRAGEGAHGAVAVHE